MTWERPQRPAIGKTLVVVVVIAIIVVAAIGLAIELNSASDTLNQGYAGQEPSSSSTVTSSSACSPYATQDNPLAGFRVLINDSSSWNATATGYSNSTADQVFSKCYTGTGTGWILIDNWNPNGGSILNVTVSKLVGDGGTLTVALGGETANTTAPFGSVKVSEVEVP